MELAENIGKLITYNHKTVGMITSTGDLILVKEPSVEGLPREYFHWKASDRGYRTYFDGFSGEIMEEIYENIPPIKEWYAAELGTLWNITLEPGRMYRAFVTSGDSQYTPNVFVTTEGFKFVVTHSDILTAEKIT